jgi:hypothetical protein
MAYKVSGTESIKDDKTVVLENVTATVRRRTFQGIGTSATFGYNMGGGIPTANTNVIEKFSFASDANSTDVGNLTSSIYAGSGNQSDTNGYCCVNVDNPPSDIQKFPFAVDANSTDVGDLTQVRYGAGGQSSLTNGYVSGGAQTDNSANGTNVIDKFPFSTDTNASDVGDLSVTRGGNSGQTSRTHGYNSGGLSNLSLPPFVVYNTIDKFSFSSDGNASDVGDLTQARYLLAGQSSDASGYASGGTGLGIPPYNTIDKFPFSSDANATDVGDLSVARSGLAGTSSSASGYSHGGSNPPGTDLYNTIDKFSFSSDGNATDVGDLLAAKQYTAGTQG